MKFLNSSERVRDRSLEVNKPTTRRTTPSTTTEQATTTESTTARTTTEEPTTEPPTTTEMTTQRTTTEVGQRTGHILKELVRIISHIPVIDLQREEQFEEPFRSRARVHASKTVELPMKTTETEDADLTQQNTEFAEINPEITAGSPGVFCTRFERSLKF